MRNLIISSLESKDEQSIQFKDLTTYGKEVWLLLKENNWNYNTLLKTFEP